MRPPTRDALPARFERFAPPTRAPRRAGAHELPNIRYLTGFSGSSALLFVTQREAIFLTDFRYETQVAEEVGELAHVRIEAESLWTGLWAVLPQLAGLEVLGFESAHLEHRDFQRLLEAGARWQWRPAARPRRVAARVEGYRRGRAHPARRRRRLRTRSSATVPQVRAGTTELQVAGILEKALRDAGSEGFPFPPIVAVGPRSALPHARASARS